MSQFGNRLRQLRIKSKLTQSELGKKLGIAFSTVSMYERGEREPDFETLESIADFFNVSMDYLHGNAHTFEDFTIFAMDGTAGQHTVTVSEEKSEKLASLLKVARDLPDDKIDMLLKMAESIK